MSELDLAALLPHIPNLSAEQARYLASQLPPEAYRDLQTVRALAAEMAQKKIERHAITWRKGLQRRLCAAEILLGRTIEDQEARRVIAEHERTQPTPRPSEKEVWEFLGQVKQTEQEVSK